MAESLIGDTAGDDNSSLRNVSVTSSSEPESEKSKLS